MTLPGNAHGQSTLVVVTGQRVQRSAAGRPGVEKHQQLQVWRQRVNMAPEQDGRRKRRVGTSGLLTGTVAALLQLSVLRRHPRGAARGGATAPLWTAQPAVGGPASLLEDGADETKPASGAAVDLRERSGASEENGATGSRRDSKCKGLGLQMEARQTPQTPPTLSMRALTVSPVRDSPGNIHSSTLNTGMLWHTAAGCLLKTHINTQQRLFK